ncbi:hypothetical protein RRG08_013830 [Elysia crispata]|uniref:Uncharacterized protein n=1 Tax=Elysia crispata TaxID=231223 RepID=A0AAE1BDG9_9GAST|nr:hypothetical protein RRG08_013830 [Elysia crispata]
MPILRGLGLVRRPNSQNTKHSHEYGEIHASTGSEKRIDFKAKSDPAESPVFTSVNAINTAKCYAYTAPTKVVAQQTSDDGDDDEDDDGGGDDDDDDDDDDDGGGDDDDGGGDDGGDDDDDGGGDDGDDDDDDDDGGGDDGDDDGDDGDGDGDDGDGDGDEDDDGHGDDDDDDDDGGFSSKRSWHEYEIRGYAVTIAVSVYRFLIVKRFESSGMCVCVCEIQSLRQYVGSPPGDHCLNMSFYRHQHVAKSYCRSPETDWEKRAVGTWEDLGGSCTIALKIPHNERVYQANLTELRARRQVPVLSSEPAIQSTGFGRKKVLKMEKGEESERNGEEMVNDLRGRTSETHKINQWAGVSQSGPGSGTGTPVECGTENYIWTTGTRLDQGISGIAVSRADGLLVLLSQLMASITSCIQFRGLHV